MDKPPILIVAFLGLVILVDLWMIIDPLGATRFSVRYFEWSNKLTRPLFGIETRVVDEARNVKSIRIWGIIFGGWLLFIFLWLSRL